MKMINRRDEHTLGAVRGVLDALVADRAKATYGYLAEYVGVHPHSASLWGLIGKVLKEDAASQKPLRSSLIVNVNTLTPGKQYFSWAREAGFSVEDEMAFWEEQLARLQLPPHAQVFRPHYG